MPFNRKHLTINVRVNVVTVTVAGICPAENNIAAIILEIIYTLVGISFLLLYNILEIISTRNDIMNSLSITSSIIPPTSNPPIIL